MTAFIKFSLLAMIISACGTEPGAQPAEIDIGHLPYITSKATRPSKPKVKKYVCDVRHEYIKGPHVFSSWKSVRSIPKDQEVVTCKTKWLWNLTDCSDKAGNEVECEEGNAGVYAIYQPK